MNTWCTRCGSVVVVPDGTTPTQGKCPRCGEAVDLAAASSVPTPQKAARAAPASDTALKFKDVRASQAASPIPRPGPTPRPEEPKPAHEPPPTLGAKAPGGIWARFGGRLSALGVLVAIAVLIAWLGGRSPSPPSPAQGPSPPPAARTEPRRPSPPSPASRPEDAARALEELRRFADSRGRPPDEVAKRCDAFIEQYRGTPHAAAAEDIRQAALASRREQDAEKAYYADENLRSTWSKPTADRLAAMDAFVKKHAGTRRAETVRKARDELVARAERDAEDAARTSDAYIDRDLKRNAYGPALGRLEQLVRSYAGTKAGDAAAARLAELRERVSTLFSEKKKAAEELAMRGRFQDAVASLDEPAKSWAIPAIQKEAEQLIADLWRRRAAVVAGYGAFLGKFDALGEECRLDELLEAARTAVAGAHADDPTLRSLLEGKAADAQLLSRALDLAVEGTKAAQADLKAEPDGTIWVQRANGTRLKATIDRPTRKGLVVDMPGLSGEVPWSELSREQLLTFAHRAPTKLTPTDHFALGLLALQGGAIKAAYGELEEAAAADKAAADAILACLRRNAAGLVLVPAGGFVAGEFRDARQLDGFLMGRYEVSNIEYAFFLKATGASAPPDWKGGACPQGQEELPVGNITWQEAAAYAEWLGMRLPTDLEAEKAARGTDGRIYPWGNQFDKRLANVTPRAVRGARPHLVPVTRGSVKGCPYPIHHIVGNVREWTSTPAGATSYRVFGGSAAEDEGSARAFARTSQRAADRYPFTGFRLVWPR